MKRTLLIILTVILLLSILVLVPSEVTLAEVVPIPVDQTKMDPVQEKYYLSHKQVGTLLYSSKEAVRESGFTPQTE